MRKSLRLYTVVPAAFLFAISLSAEIRWLEKEYDFGLMKEQLGPKRGSVRFVNLGPEETVITGARPSCGCTSVEYPKDPIAVGDTAQIFFTYDPTDRPGRFEKSIRVYVGDFDTNIIRIRGNVLGTPESLSVLYPIVAGPLRFSEEKVYAGEVKYGNTQHYFINGYNQTTDTIHPSATSDNKALAVDMSAKAIGPGDIITFSLILNTHSIAEPGPISIPITITPDLSSPAETIVIPFEADIKPDFRGMTPEQEKNAPRCYVLPETVDVGIISGNKAKEFNFVISNQGLSQMKVLRINPLSKALAVKRFPASIKANKNEKVVCTLDPRQLENGPFKIKINIYSDDPLHPIRTVSVCGIRE